MLWLEFSNATTIALYSCISINKILIWWKQDRYYQNLLCLTVLSCSFSPGVACPNGLTLLHFESLLCFWFFFCCPSFFFFFHSFLLFPLISSFRDTLASYNCCHCHLLVRIARHTPRNQDDYQLWVRSETFSSWKHFPSLLLPARGEDYKHLRVQSCKRQELRSCHCWGWPLYMLDPPADHTAKHYHGINGRNGRSIVDLESVWGYDGTGRCCLFGVVELAYSWWQMILW